MIHFEHMIYQDASDEILFECQNIVTTLMESEE